VGTCHIGPGGKPARRTPPVQGSAPPPFGRPLTAGTGPPGWLASSRSDGAAPALLPPGPSPSSHESPGRQRRLHTEDQPSEPLRATQRPISTGPCHPAPSGGARDGPGPARLVSLRRTRTPPLATPAETDGPSTPWQWWRLGGRVAPPVSIDSQPVDTTGHQVDARRPSLAA
jgi:hypothetical protein